MGNSARSGKSTRLIEFVLETSSAVLSTYKKHYETEEKTCACNQRVKKC